MRSVNEEGRLRIVEMMWELVYADGQVSEFEDNVVWRAADLLGVSSRDRIDLKHRVAANNGRRPPAVQSRAVQPTGSLGTSPASTRRRVDVRRAATGHDEILMCGHRPLPAAIAAMLLSIARRMPLDVRRLQVVTCVPPRAYALVPSLAAYRANDLRAWNRD